MNTSYNGAAVRPLGVSANAIKVRLILSVRKGPCYALGHILTEVHLFLRKQHKAATSNPHILKKARVRLARWSFHGRHTELIRSGAAVTRRTCLPWGNLSSGDKQRAAPPSHTHTLCAQGCKELAKTQTAPRLFASRRLRRLAQTGSHESSNGCVLEVN